MDKNELQTNFGSRQCHTKPMPNFTRIFVWLVINYNLVFNTPKNALFEELVVIDCEQIFVWLEITFEPI